MRITVTALTERGREALKANLQARRKMSYIEKKLFDKMFNMVVKYDMLEMPTGFIISSKLFHKQAAAAMNLIRDNFKHEFNLYACVENVDYYYKFEGVE